MTKFSCTIWHHILTEGDGYAHVTRGPADCWCEPEVDVLHMDPLHVDPLRVENEDVSQDQVSHRVVWHQDLTHKLRIPGGSR